MKMIIGGAYQGKTAFAENLTGILPQEWIDGAACAPDDIYTCRGIRNFHEYIRRVLQAGGDPARLPAELSAELMTRNPKIVIVTNELGYGIVPMDPEDRSWREADGRICAALAAEADEVWRVICGIGQKLKG